MKKVVIVDDHPIVLDGLKTMINALQNFEVVAAVSSAESALKYLKSFPIDILITDLEMPAMDGFQLIQEVKKNFNCHIMVLSMHSERSKIKEAMENEVGAYLLKDSDREDIIHALNCLSNNKQYYSPALLEKGFSTAKEEAKNKLNLTDRELDVLQLLAEGLSNKEVGEKLFLSPKTVDSHRTNLMKKIGVRNIVGLVRYAISEGIVK